MMARRYPVQAAALGLWVLLLGLGLGQKALGIPGSWLFNAMGLASGLLAGAVSGGFIVGRRVASSRVAVGLLLGWAGMGLYRYFGQGDESGLLLFCMWGGGAAGHLAAALSSRRGRAGSAVDDS